MPFSRRRFVKWAASMSAFAWHGRGLAAPIAFRPELLPPKKEVWDQQLWMAKLGPKYTGNKAHAAFVEFLATQLQAHGLDVARERYSFPRWDAKRWEIAVAPASGSPFKAPVTSYFPYSGQTPASGVTGELMFAGTNPKFTLDGLQGKVALIECPT